MFVLYEIYGLFKPSCSIVNDRGPGAHQAPEQHSPVCAQLFGHRVVPRVRLLRSKLASVIGE